MCTQEEPVHCKKAGRVAKLKSLLLTLNPCILYDSAKNKVAAADAAGDQVVVPLETVHGTGQQPRSRVSHHGAAAAASLAATTASTAKSTKAEAESGAGASVHLLQGAGGG